MQVQGNIMGLPQGDIKVRAMLSTHDHAHVDHAHLNQLRFFFFHFLYLFSKPFDNTL